MSFNRLFLGHFAFGRRTDNRTGIPGASGTIPNHGASLNGGSFGSHTMASLAGGGGGGVSFGAPNFGRNPMLRLSTSSVSSNPSLLAICNEDLHQEAQERAWLTTLHEAQTADLMCTLVCSTVKIGGAEVEKAIQDPSYALDVKEGLASTGRVKHHFVKQVTTIKHALPHVRASLHNVKTVVSHEDRDIAQQQALLDQQQALLDQRKEANAARRFSINAFDSDLGKIQLVITECENLVVNTGAVDRFDVANPYFLAAGREDGEDYCDDDI